MEDEDYDEIRQNVAVRFFRRATLADLARWATMKHPEVAADSPELGFTFYLDDFNKSCLSHRERAFDGVEETVNGFSNSEAAALFPIALLIARAMKSATD